MSNKNYFYRVNPESVLSELTTIKHEDWLQFFLNFFHDLREDDPMTAKTHIASKIILESYNFRELRSKAGKKSVEQKKSNAEQKETYVGHMLKDVQPIAVAIAVSETITVNKKEKDKTFVPPSVEEVTEYCRERKNNVDPQKFVDHYETRGWIPKGYTKQMKSWKAAVRTWETNSQQIVNERPTRLLTFADAKEQRAQEQRRAFMEGS